MVALLWLGLTSINPLTESVVVADESHVDQELVDLLRFMHEETSLSRESSPPGEPSFLEVPRIGADGVETSEPERGDFWKVVGATTSKVFPEDRVSVHCPWVPVCESSWTR